MTLLASVVQRLDDQQDEFPGDNIFIHSYSPDRKSVTVFTRIQSLQYLEQFYLYLSRRVAPTSKALSDLYGRIANNAIQGRYDSEGGVPSDDPAREHMASVTGKLIQEAQASGDVLTIEIDPESEI